MQNNIPDCHRRQLTDPAKWIDNYYDYLLAFGLSKINDIELVRDLVQETFLAALENLGGFQGKCSEKTWLAAILKNKIYLNFRKKKNEKVVLGLSRGPTDAHSPANEEVSAWQSRQATDPDSGSISQDIQPILKNAVNGLPAVWRRVFIMKYVEKRCTSIICEELKITPSNYWIICHRMKGNLRAVLEKNYF